VNPVARSFGWPFRGRWQPVWAIGLLCLLLLPLGAIPLLGYSVAAVREAREEGPPTWRFGGRLLLDGLAVLGLIALIAAPFVLAAVLLASALGSPGLWHSSGGLLTAESTITAAMVVALPWGIVMLLVVPHSLARFAASGAALDLFDIPSSIRGVRRDFATWNVTVAAIVTAWAIGAASLALCCVGAVPGTLYAILVSAHATASLGPEGANPSAR
jgi:uncharacterized protein DUF4013